MHTLPQFSKKTVSERGKTFEDVICCQLNSLMFLPVAFPGFPMSEKNKKVTPFRLALYIFFLFSCHLLHHMQPVSSENSWIASSQVTHDGLNNLDKKKFMKQIKFLCNLSDIANLSLFQCFLIFYYVYVRLHCTGSLWLCIATMGSPDRLGIVIGPCGSASQAPVSGWKAYKSVPGDLVASILPSMEKKLSATVGRSGSWVDTPLSMS